MVETRRKIVHFFHLGCHGMVDIGVIVSGTTNKGDELISIPSRSEAQV